MAAIARAAHPTLTSKDIRKVFWDDYARYPAEYKKIFYPTPVTGRYEKFSRAYPFGAVPEKTEGGPIEVRTIDEGGTVEFTFPTYSMGFTITKEMLEDDQTGIMRRLGAQLAKSVNFTMEKLSWNVLTNGFAANAGQVGTDGVTLFNAAHPLGVTGFSQGNASSDSLSTTSLQAALVSYKKQKNDANMPILLKPNLLIIPPDLEWKAKELLISRLDPDSANNAVNTLQNEGLSYFVFHFGDSTTNWFLTSRPMEGCLMSMNRRNTQLPPSYVNPLTGDQTTVVSFRYRPGFVDWRGTFGSAGA